MNIRFTAKTIERLCDSTPHGRAGSLARKILQLCVDRAKHAAPHFIRCSRARNQPPGLTDESPAGKNYAEGYDAASTRGCSRAAEAHRPAGPHRHPAQELKDINKQMSTGETKAPRQAR